MSVTQFSLAEAFANITGLETIERLGTIMVKDSGSWVPVSSQAVQQTVQQSGFKFLGNSVTGGNVVSSIGQPQVAKSVWGITEAYTGRCFATPTQLSPGIQAALSNTGRVQVGSTALQPITRMEIVQSTGGEILETQAKGILTKVPMKAAMRACAAAQGIMLGVEFVEANPQLATKLSNAIFRTDIDPENIASIVENTTVWANIKDGVCFLAEDFINAIKNVFMEEGVYNEVTEGYTVDYTPSASSIKSVEALRYGTALNGWLPGHLYYTRYQTKLEFNTDLTPSRTVLILVAVYGTTSNTRLTLAVASLDNFMIRNSYRSNDSWDTAPIPAEVPAPSGSYSNAVVQNINGTNIYLTYPITSSGGTDFSSLSVNITTDLAGGYLKTNSNLSEQQLAEMAYNYLVNGDTSSEITSSETAGTKKIPGSTYPTSGGSIATDYPDWWAERTETVNGYDEDGDITYMPWLPVNIFQPTGDDPSDYSQTSSWEGTVTTDDEMVDIIDGIDESIESDPDASEQTNPQEQVYPNPNPQPSPSTPTITPVTPTVDVSDGESPDPTSPILTTAITSGLAHIYNPTLTEVKAVGRKLWTLDFVENLKKIFVDPMDGIVGFLIIYATPKTGERKNIVLGIYDTEVQSKIVTNQYVTIDCGTIAVDEYFNDARDYSPYTNVSLYLPFIGVVELYADDVINSHVNIQYHVDVLTGTCLATVKVSKGNASAVVYQYPGNCGVQIPLTSMNYSSIITSLFSVGISAVGGAALGTAKAVGRRLAGAAYGAARAAAINASSSTIDVQQSGSIGSNAGAMGIRNPYFIIRRPVTSDAYAYNMQYGYPANKWVLLENMKGFTRIKSIHLDSLVCTDEEKEMIDSALKEGVVF